MHVAMPNYTGPMFPGHRTYEGPPAPFDPEEERDLAGRGIEAWLAQVSPSATGPDLMGHVGGDFRHPTPRLSTYVDWWNAASRGSEARLASPEEFFTLLRNRQDSLPVLDGEISPPMHSVVKSVAQLQELAQAPQHVREEGLGRFGEGYGEAKVERKQLDRAVHLALREAEQASTWAWLLGASPITSDLAALYRPILTYGHHDPFIGCVVHDDYDKIITQLIATQQRAEALRDEALAFVGRQTDTQSVRDRPGRNRAGLQRTLVVTDRTRPR